MSEVASRESNSSQWWRLLGKLQLGPLIALAVIVAFFYIADGYWGSGNFLSDYSIRMNLNAAALIAVPAMGMTMIIIAGGIDLSAGTALTLCGTILAVGLKTGPDAADGTMYLFGLLALVIAAGCACGAANGLLITGTNVVPFIVTLGTMTIFLGIGQIISSESTVYAPTEKLPQWLRYLCYTGSVGSRYLMNGIMIPTSVLISIALALLVSGMLNLTVFGRNTLAVGSNESTARLCGINVPATKLLVYSLAGVFTAIGGVLYFANIKNGNPTDGSGKELEIIAAVVLGGGSLSGGRGSVLGTILGALIITTIRSGCTQLSIPNTYSQIVIGAIIIIAVIVDQLRHGSPEWLFRMIRR
ncbi:ABC transporter permease [Stieleria varia]|uniref:Ribose transport system permease protein RbsC n=1 Tax=Stieleria varia TaxID=2528005 RepID=A0A5C5ZZ51_9BACT|nr:ABC transporter permease [Stieleria varia]TWT92361.1 Ribose transport system permease protein RbsC [Stieleria varia]